MAASIFLRQSNVKLQEELLKTNHSYREEKAALRSHLSNLRLDLTELHNDDRTITTVDSHSRLDTSVSSEHELKRLAEFDGESGRSLQLPAIKNLHISDGGSHSNNNSNRKEKKNESSNTARSNKTLRFNGNENINNYNSKSSDLDNNNNNNHNNNNNNNHTVDKQESQKFLELQKNQEFLRSIGRANLKEKRQSLIRLPTITSAKKRNSQWDSGNNVSRPKGQSTSFEQNLTLYVEDSIVLENRAFKIPSVKDSQRSEIQLSAKTKRPSLGKRKVQFTRPRAGDHINNNYTPRENKYPSNPALDVSTTEASSLNTTLADVSLEDNTLGNITFDEEAFNKQLASKQHNQTQSSIRSNNHNHHHNHNNNNNNNNNSFKRLNQSSNSPLQPIAESDSGVVSSPTTTTTTNATAAKSCPDNKNQNINTTSNTNNNSNNNNNNNKNNEEQSTLPPVKIKTLARKNLILHDMNNMRTSFPKLNLSFSPENRSVKDSDRSVGTKLSRLSQETESWKSTYVQNVDPDKRNKTLTEIMFAVRSRMRENEETLRFGETPRRKDKTLSDLFLGTTPTRNIATPRWSDATQSPRKGKISKRGRPSIPPTKAEKSTRRTDSTAHLQGYLRKMCRQKRDADQQQAADCDVSNDTNNNISPRRQNQRRHVNHNNQRHALPSIHKAPRLIAQEA